MSIDDNICGFCGEEEEIALKITTSNLNIYDMCRRLIVFALEKKNANILRTAKDLGMSRQGLYNQFEKFGINPKLYKK